MTPGMLRQVIRQAQKDRKMERLEYALSIAIWTWFGGMVMGSLAIKLF
jgi:hypothetical protein